MPSAPSAEDETPNSDAAAEVVYSVWRFAMAAYGRAEGENLEVLNAGTTNAAAGTTNAAAGTTNAATGTTVGDDKVYYYCK